MKKQLDTVVIEKLVHGGQGLGVLADGRKVFVWGALPGEKVELEIRRSKKSYAEAVTTKVLNPSKDRVEPKEANYLATSPWQIMTLESENYWKKAITKEIFTQAGIKLPSFEVYSDGNEYEYRNKMEYSFWGDDDGVHLALYGRGSHQKQIVTGSELAMPAVDLAANSVVKQLNNKGVRAGDLKTIIVRCDQKNGAVASLFVKQKEFPKLTLPEGLRGLRLYLSNPKSPASIRTELLYELGDSRLQDELLGNPFSYDVDSFFQVNVPVFEQALGSMKQYCRADDMVDMYAGVGSIGLSVVGKSVDLVENDPATAAMAEVNAKASGLIVSVTQVASEKALDYITNNKPIIFDPPRAGLHAAVVDRILEIKPPMIVYLSCNPATQARDIALLKSAYDISDFEVFNFFPKTPHIESLAVLKRKRTIQ